MNRINTKDGGVYPMVYTILYQFGDGLYHPILVICWMIHSWVYYTRHFSTVFSVPMCTSLLRTLNFDWCWLNDLEPSLFFSVCVCQDVYVCWLSPILVTQTSQITKFECLLLQIPIFPHTKPGWWYAYPSEKYMTSSVIVPYCSQLIWKVIKFHGSSHHQAETVMFGVKNAMFKVKVPFKSPHPAPWTRGTPGWSRKPAPSPKTIGKWCFNQQQNRDFRGI